MSSLFSLAELDEIVNAIDSPDFTMRDEVVRIPGNASIRSMLPTLSEEQEIPGAISETAVAPHPKFSIIAFPLRDIPLTVTGSIASYSLRDLFPSCRQQRWSFNFAHLSELRYMRVPG